MDKDKYIGKEDNKITDHEIKAYQRGQKDIDARDRLLNSQVLRDSQILKVFREYARGIPLTEIAINHSISSKILQRTLGAFGITEPEEAYRLLDSGKLSELLDLRREQINQKQLEALKIRESAQRRLDELEASKQSSLSPEQKEQSLVQRNHEARKKNLEDVARNEKLATESDSLFRVDPERENDFRIAIKEGVEHCRRMFGGSKKDIVNEARRLLPDLDIDMLRP